MPDESASVNPRKDTTMMLKDEMLTAAQLAEEINFPTTTLAYWRTIGKGPDYVKVERWVRYRRSDVDAWKAGLTRRTHEAVR